jgi:hypothetical protein
MKGIVFTEFLNLVESRWGATMVEDMIDACDLPSRGAYTAVGTYSHKEIADLAVELSRRSNVALPDLLQVFGQHLFHTLAKAYPDFVDPQIPLLGFLCHVENYIHVEVLKLYPDAELPRFECTMHDDGSLSMLYQSSRHLEDLCEGLIRGAAEHYATPVDISRAVLPEGVMFHIRPRES